LNIKLRDVLDSASNDSVYQQLMCLIPLQMIVFTNN